MQKLLTRMIYLLAKPNIIVCFFILLHRYASSYSRECKRGHVRPLTGKEREEMERNKVTAHQFV